VQTLLDEAAAKCGTDRALAAVIGKSPSQITDMRKGVVTISPQTVGLLADVLELDGDEARRLAASAIVSNAPPDRRAALRRAFFVCWAIGELWLAGRSYEPPPRPPKSAAMGHPDLIATVYTSCAVTWRTLVARLRRNSRFSWRGLLGLGACALAAS
jgi:hypothetical protein